MPDRKTQIVERLKSEGAETLTFFRDLPANAWTTQVYDIGPEWDVREVLCHFVSAESSLTELFRRIITTGEGVPDDFDIDRWNNSKVSKMKELTSDGLIAEFETVRAATIAWAETLSEDNLDKVGRHPFLGMDKVENMLKLLYRHNMLHQRDIRKVFQTGQPIPPSD